MFCPRVKFLPNIINFFILFITSLISYYREGAVIYQVQRYLFPKSESMALDFFSYVYCFKMLYPNNNNFHQIIRRFIGF